ncbi:hypothetical protein L1286_05965 [Pseudoalteromonas sp. SMS1]|uniref:hypothetical protein n=1 Tax=Pseudoalteromonas sp. SMS1 TaxID=2908894 RepID=UPI001F1D5807|nr:hypothetical protein [Pseudoalteromonas sp. SMS1]MCF2857004.1 hypothetical protein [Pseudoalteromonas sp. SMS1]
MLPNITPKDEYILSPGGSGSIPEVDEEYEAPNYKNEKDDDADGESGEGGSNQSGMRH